MDLSVNSFSCDEVDSDIEDLLYSQIHHGLSSIQTNVKLTPEENCKRSAKKTFPKEHTKEKPVIRIAQQCENQSIFNHVEKPVIKVLSDSELLPEKPNRTVLHNTRVERSYAVSRFLGRKTSRTPTKTKDLSDQCIIISSDDDLYRTSETPTEEVVLNIGSRSDNSGIDHSKAGHQDLWHVDIEDQYKSPRDSSKFSKMTCYNCKEKGHLSKSCKKPKHVPSCFLCGQLGHTGDRCLNPLCSRCLLPGHTQFHCNWSPNNIPTCPLCRCKGHLCQECPSLWRRYHMTTTCGPPVNPTNHPDYKCQPRKIPSYCFNCGRQGHFGFACTSKKSNFPTDRRITDYKTPKTIGNYNNKFGALWKKKLYLAESKETPKPPKKRRRIRTPSEGMKVKNLSNYKSDNLVTINPSTEANFPRKRKNNPRLQPEVKNQFMPETRKQRRKRRREESKSWNAMNRLIDWL